MRTSYVPDLDDGGGAVQGVYTVTIDVHELTEVQQRLARTAERDALTDKLLAAVRDNREWLLETLQYPLAKRAT